MDAIAYIQPRRGRRYVVLEGKGMPGGSYVYRARPCLENPLNKSKKINQANERAEFSVEQIQSKIKPKRREWKRVEKTRITVYSGKLGKSRSREKNTNLTVIWETRQHYAAAATVLP